MNCRLIKSVWAAALLGAAFVATAQARAPEVNPDAAVLADFKTRVQEYVQLRKGAVTGEDKMRETEDPADIREAQAVQAERIRQARKDAKPGDLFTPEVQSVFRKLMNPRVTGPEGQQTKAAIKEDAPAAFRLRVNASYPEGTPLPTVPPNVLANLPRLPEELEYRIVDGDLILRDVDANLIVDFIPNALR